jgi:hypothetical protein
MKKALFVITTLFMMNQVRALTAAEFSAAFIAQTNHLISETNAERREKKLTPYCEKLNPVQQKLVKVTAAKDGITVGEFAETVAEKLKCYPEFWAPWERKNIGGVLFNTKAFVMDTFIVRQVLEDLSPGRVPNDAELLLEYSSPF